MERDNSDDFKNSEDESFVTKVRSRVSGLFNSSISRIFGSHEKRESVIRRRENDDDVYECQPPCKKAKKPLRTSDFREDNNGSLNHLYSVNSLSDASTMYTNLIEPVAGPSNGNKIDICKTFPSDSTHKHVINEKDSDSGESTSGYSSMPRICSRELVRAVIEPTNQATQSTLRVSSEKEALQSKRLFDNLTPERLSRSLFDESRLSPMVKNKSLSSRRPSTNTSNFSSPNFIDRTVTTNRIINSPFYNGPTVYGGASAYNSKDKMSESRRQQLKHSFIVKPVNKPNENNPCTSLSKTARKILSALEQYSAPMMDAEKIPLPTKSEKKAMLSKYVGVNPYHMKDSRVSSNRELLVPSVPELLMMKQKQRFQDKTDKIRQIAISSSKTSGNNDYKINDNNQQKHTNKMKAKVSSLRKKAPAIEILEEVVLKPVPFSLPENKLPKFDLVIPPPDSLNNVYTKKEDIKACVESTILTQKSEGELSKRKDSEYTFAEPLVIADNLKSVVAINNFKFSEPLSKKLSSLENECNKQILIKEGLQFKETDVKNSDSSNFQNSFDCGTNEKDLMQKFRAPEGSWSCSTCLITNKKDALKCIACETLRTNQSIKNDVTLNQMVDQWECTTCLVKNNNCYVKCVVCSTPMISKNTLKPNGIDNNKKCNNETFKSNGHDHFKTKSDFGEKFKPASDTWECQTCLVRNKSNVEKCIACESRREGTVEMTLKSQLKTSLDTWECDTCLIRNKNDIKNCAACQTPREKVFAPLETRGMNKVSNKWECPTCMVKNDSNVEKCVCCETAKPGVTLINKNTVNMFNYGVNKSQFKFGIPKDILETSSGLPVTTSVNTTSSFLVESKSKSSDSNTGKKTTDEKIELKPINVDKATPISNFIAPKCDSENKSVTPAPVFKFGSSNTSTKLEDPNANLDKNQFKSPSLHPDATNASSLAGNATIPTTKIMANVDPKATTVSSFTFGAPKSDIKDAGKLKNTQSSTPAFNLSDNQKSNTENKFPATKESKVSFMFEKNNAESTNLFGKGEKFAPVEKPVFTFGSLVPHSERFTYNTDPNTPIPKLNLDEMKPKSPAAFTFSKPTQDTKIYDAGIAANAKNGGFNFGNAPTINNQAAVFSFGAAQKQTNLNQNSSGGFNFSSPIAPVGGFNFSAPAPTFDATIKPSFNFTGGATPTFAATPTEAGGPTGVRKFKKAVRRTAQR